VIHDGGADRPYRLVLNSKVPGQKGQILFNTDVSNLSLATLSQAADAKVVMGDTSSPHAVVVTGDSNTFTDVIPGVTLELNGVSGGQPVQVSVSQDIESAVTDVQAFISAFNNAMDQVDELTRFDSETEEKGILLGDDTVRKVQSRLFSMVNDVIGEEGMQYRRLTDLGIMVDSSSGSARLTMARTLEGGMTIDGESRLREALADDPEAVGQFFTRMALDDDDTSVAVGFAARMKEALQSITSTAGGLLTEENDRLQGKVDQFEERAADMQELLDMKEARLYAEFQAMEAALANLSAQQSALASLSSMAANARASGGGGLGL
jgi:flagellar hook-associated protein 2